MKDCFTQVVVEKEWMVALREGNAIRSGGSLPTQ